MKKAVIIFCCIMILSCKTQEITLSPFVTVFKSDWVGNIPPEYIILRIQPEVFEKYAPSIYGGIVGKWNIKNDTLFLLPQYEYYSRNLELIFSKITAQDTSVATIPQQYIMKSNCLIDVTDYSIILPELVNNQNYKVLYKRVKE